MFRALTLEVSPGFAVVCLIMITIVVALWRTWVARDVAAVRAKKAEEEAEHWRYIGEIKGPPQDVFDRLVAGVAGLQRKWSDAERRRKEIDQKFRRIVEATHEGVWTVDVDGRTTYVNTQMTEMLGVTSEGILGRSLFDFVHEDEKEVATKAYERFRDGERKRQEFRFTRADGEELWGSVSLAPLNDDAGTYLGALASVANITDQKRMQEQLLMSDRMVTVGTLAAGVTHEVNNPLAAIIANLDLAERHIIALDKELPDSSHIEELRTEIRDSREAAGRVRQIARDLNVFSRAHEERHEVVEIERVLDASVRMARNELRNRAKLVRDSEAVPAVLASESRLVQVFLNLIINATHAIEEGHPEQNEIRLHTSYGADGRVIVEVSDTGTGMPPAVLRRLFTPFFTTKDVGVGTGLGLSICHRIVTSVGGEITVSSQVGVGTTFRVLLPAAPDAPLRAPSLVPAYSPATRRGRVLIVDDEQMLCDVLECLLGDEHEVVTTPDPRDALAQIDKQAARFDVILCDLMMPRMTGMDLHAAIQRIDPDQANRMIFFTGGAFTPQARTFLDSVPNRCLEKPFDADRLVALVNERVA